ncbi:MAG: XdhC family protein, partial [Anaerolineae bacterium]|nr:XdhC family protein [Anaerolineae bacterium]
PKIDDPALISAVPSEAFYVGALGSKKTHQKRKKRLAETGMAKDCIEKIHSPVGLDIGAEEPEEIALAIMAEIVAARSKAAD